MRSALLFALALSTTMAGAGIGVRAQSSSSAGGPAPAFEVASVKVNASGSTASSSRSGKGSVTIVNVPLRQLIANAYRTRLERVVGGPGWIDDTRFDITARAPQEAPPEGQLFLMMRTLLADRFKLTARTEMRDAPIYALVLARADGRLGPNLKSSSDCEKAAQAPTGPLAPPAPGQRLECGVRVAGDPRATTILGGARPLGDLARALDGTDGRVVVDRTGLTGTYDFHLRFARDGGQGQPPADADLPTVFTALQEQLGLKLDSQSGAVEFVVIDRVERPVPD